VSGTLLPLQSQMVTGGIHGVLLKKGTFVSKVKSRKSGSSKHGNRTLCLSGMRALQSSRALAAACGSPLSRRAETSPESPGSNPTRWATLVDR